MLIVIGKYALNAALTMIGFGSLLAIVGIFYFIFVFKPRARAVSDFSRAERGLIVEQSGAFPPDLT